MASFLTDEHVPRVFVTTLTSSGHDVLRANDAFGEATQDESLLRFCADEKRLLVTHDKKDFAGEVGNRVDHAGIVVYTDATYLRDDPDSAVRTVERVLSYYPPTELTNEVVWLDEWRT